MENKNVVYFKATENGTEIAVPEPVDRNIISLVISRPMSVLGEPITKYGVDYHMAYLDTVIKHDDIFSPVIVFEGKQGDFFYCFCVSDYQPTDEHKVDTKCIAEMINSGNGELYVKWWLFNDAGTVIQPDFKEEDGELVYDIQLTDELTLQVAVEGKLDNEHSIRAMTTFCDGVRMGEYRVRAF